MVIYAVPLELIVFHQTLTFSKGATRSAHELWLVSGYMYVPLALSFINTDHLRHVPAIYTCLIEIYVVPLV